MNKDKQRGFTITELMFAMVFIAFIMVMIVVVLIQTMSIYNKGLALRQINQTGRQIAEDITRQLRYGARSYVDYADGNNRLCIGNVAYVWNITPESGDREQVNRLRDSSTGNFTDFNMIRISEVQGTNFDCNTAGDIVTGTGSNDIKSGNITRLIGSQVAVLGMDFTLSGDGRLAGVEMVLSTTGENRPQFIDGHWQCFLGEQLQPNSFCAFGVFNNIVYIRN